MTQPKNWDQKELKSVPDRGQFALYEFATPSTPAPIPSRTH